MTLTKLETRNKTADGMTYTGETYRCGEYEITKYTTQKEDGTIIRESLEVYTPYDAHHERYLPEIYYSNNYFGEHKPEFTIGTTSYGSMKPEEIQKVIEGYQAAVEAVKILTEAFC